MKNRKYVMAAAGTLLLLLLGTFYAWSLFRVYVSEAFPELTAAQLSLNFSLFVIIFCLGSLLAGIISKKLGAHIIIRISAVLILVGMLITSQITRFGSSSALMVLYTGYGGFCGFGVGMAYNSILSGVSRWFPEKSGFISGLLLMGYGLGSLVCGSAVSAVADRTGFSGAFISTAVVIGVVIMTLSGLFKKAPDVQASGKAETGLTTAVTLKTPTFWFQFFWALFAGCVGLMVINSAALIAMCFGVAAALGLLVSLFNGFGRIGSGFIYDKLKSKSIYVVIAMAFSAGILLVAAWKTGNSALMFPGMLLAGMSYGSSMAVNTALVRDFYGMKHYASNFAIVTLAGIPSSFIGPYISGMLQDASGGDYLTTFYAMLVFAAIALVCALGITATRKKLPEF